MAQENKVDVRGNEEVSIRREEEQVACRLSELSVVSVIDVDEVESSEYSSAESDDESKQEE